ncbi:MULTISPECIES: YggT family protein [Legionella]|nr:MULTISPECIES: YggT family protein [Legionella]MCP0914108.1 YggT family protein [Legionella sp. 27cVA30]
MNWNNHEVTMGSGLVAVGYFLFHLFFGLLISLLWLRILLRYFRISALNPVSQLLHKFSQPMLKPITGLFPVKTLISRYDWPAIIVLIAIEIIKFALINILFLGMALPLLWILIYVLADLIIQPCNLLFYAILAYAIMSWVNPMWKHPLADILYRITQPALSIGRRIIPNISGFDFSPIVIMIILKVIVLFIQASLPLPLI